MSDWGDDDELTEDELVEEIPDNELPEEEPNADKVPEERGLDEVPKKAEDIPDDDIPDDPDTKLDPGWMIVPVPDGGLDPVLDPEELDT